MLIMAFLSLLSGVLAGKYAAAASSGFACNLRDGMYENIQRFSFSNIDKYSTAGLVTRMTTDVTNVQNSYQMILRIAVRAPLMLVCSMAMCFLINVRLSLIFLAAIVVLAAALGLIMTRTTKIFDEVFRKYDDLNASVQENVSAIRVVKAFVREEHENNKFTRAAENLYRLFVKAEGLLALNNPVMMLVVYGCIISLSWFGAKFIVVGGLTTGELTSMFSYVMSVLMSLMMLSMIFVMVTMSAASGRRIAQVLDEKADLTNPENPLMSIPDGSISFSHVSFSYKHGSGEETLHDIDLQIRPGETIGIIGGTGSGKSSLVHLLSGIYDYDRGSITINGVELRDIAKSWLRRHVQIVLQEPFLFSKTIYENIHLSDHHAMKEDVVEAARMSCIHNDIEEFDQGYETMVGEKGVTLSGGQKQRVAIARSLLAKSPIMVFDDSLSALDMKTDAMIQEALQDIRYSMTMLMITHRVASAQNADRILVLEHGRLVQEGTHEELIKQDGLYRRIYEIQKEGGEAYGTAHHEGAGV